MSAESESDSRPQRRIAVFTGDLSYSVRRGILDIDDAMPDTTWLVLVHSPRKPLRVLLRNQRLNLHRNGWRWIPYQLGDVLSRLGGGTGSGTKPPAAALGSGPRFRVVHVDDIHAPSTLAILRDFDPDLGLSLAAPILKRALFALPRHGTLNLHKGRLPDYRGMPPAFWELWNDEKLIGCTVHQVDDKLDTGAVVCRGEIRREPFSTLRGLQLRLDQVGVDLMRTAVQAVFEGSADPDAQQAHQGKTYRKPTLEQMGMLQRRLDRSQPKSVPAPKRIAKDAALGLAFGLARIAGGRAKPRITVLLYHRVSDDARDNLTVGVEQFDRQIALLSRHCDVLPIEDVLASESIEGGDRPRVAVTFDDGYLDNYIHAAPILRRHAVPASFFVSTGIVDAQGRFPHDVRRGNAAIPVLNWDQLRRMREWGFTIGSHTVSHLDCAAGSEAAVRSELAESRDRLREELGIDKVIFAYPYGGRSNMTPERLQLVRDAGYVGCLAAYGGTNIGRVDRFNVLRRGIHWEFSDRAFLFECLGLGS